MDNGESSYRRFLGGDQNGIAEIIRDYKDGLILYINSFVCDLYTAEELCEDTFVKLMVKKPHYKGNASFKTWLYAIGRNIALDYLKHSKKKFNLSLEAVEELPCDQQDFLSTYLKEEQKLALHRAMSGIKDEYRQALWLTYFEGLSNKETAYIMKKSLHSTETLIYRAKKQLKIQLEKEDFCYEEL